MKFLFNKSDVFRETFTFYQYNDNNCRIVLNKYCRQKGFEELKNNNYIPQEDSEEVQRVSLSRSRRRIREIALSNNFEYFATITVNEKNCDRFSLTKCQENLRKRLHKLKRRNKNFAFLFITEKHKNGAFHFHGLVRGLDLYVNKNGYYSNTIFDEIGFNSFSKIKDYTKCCNYICKYISKDCVKNEQNQIYFCSRGLKKPIKYNIKPIDLNWNYENDFVKIKDFNINDLSQEDLIKFLTLEEEF